MSPVTTSNRNPALFPSVALLEACPMTRDRGEKWFGGKQKKIGCSRAFLPRNSGDVVSASTWRSGPPRPPLPAYYSHMTCMTDQNISHTEGELSRLRVER